MERCDVLIIGGGPAGSTLAWKLKQQGKDVLILDKQEFPRDKVCAGWVTPEVMQSLQIDLEDYARNNVLQPIRAFETGILGNNMVHTQYDRVMSYGIRRREFDDYLLRRSGVRTRLGEGFKSMEYVDGLWTINGEIQAPLVIGAGGHFCPVARTLGSKGEGKETVVAAQEVEFLLTQEQKQRCPIKPDTPELYFLKDLSGYAWVFRKGDYLNIGLGREDNQKLSDHVNAFVDYLKDIGRIPRECNERFHGHAYLLRSRSRQKIVDNGVMLIGDAIGLAYDESGEGIRPAIESALMAATVIEQSAGDYSSARLHSYLGLLDQRFGKSGVSRNVIPQSLRERIAAQLMRMRWFAKSFVVERWFLHKRQAALL